MTIGRYPPQPEESGPHQLANPVEPLLHDVVVAALRHRLLIFVSILLIVGLGVAYTLYAIPLYDATSMVRFESELVDVPQLVQLQYNIDLVSTEVEALKAQSAAIAVIDSLGLRAQLAEPRRGQVTNLFSSVRVSPSADSQTLVLVPRGKGAFAVSRPNSTVVIGVAKVGDTTRIAGILISPTSAALTLSEITLSVGTLADAAQSFEKALVITRPARDADLITITVRNADPVRAAAAANLMATNLIADRQVAHRGGTDAAVSFLKQQHDSLGRQLRAAEDSLRAYQQREHVIDVPQQASDEVARLAKLQADLAGVRAERDALASLVTQFRHDMSGGSLGDQAVSRRLMAFPALLSNQSAAVLLGALAQVETERSQLLIRRMPGDSDVQVLTRRIRELEAQLEGVAETYLQSLSNQVISLDSEASRFSSQLGVLPEKELQTARRERDVKVLNDMWVLVQTRLKEAQITSAGADPTVRIADAAIPPVKPAKPKPLIYIALSLMLGCVVGVSGALAREYSDHAVRSRADATSAARPAGSGCLSTVAPSEWRPSVPSGRRYRPRRSRTPRAQSRAGSHIGTDRVAPGDATERIGRVHRVVQSALREPGAGLSGAPAQGGGVHLARCPGRGRRCRRSTSPWSARRAASEDAADRRRPALWRGTSSARLPPQAGLRRTARRYSRAGRGGATAFAR